MKKALVLIVIGLFSFGAFAADGLSGEWSTSIGVNPGAVELVDFFSTFSSSLDVTYTLGDWDFNSLSSFDKDGWADQAFTVSGVLGAFTASTVMNFSPVVVTQVVYEDLGLQTASYPLAGGFECITMVEDTVTMAPMFDDWKVEASVSIAGVNFGGLFFLEGLSGIQTKDLLYFYIADGADVWVQTGSSVSSGKTLGSGMRISVSGDVAGATLTNYTYFNLSQADATSKVGCPVIGKKSTISIANEGCGVTFTENYTMLEGLTFGCYDFDIALKMTCAGFSYIQFIASEIPLFGWANLTFGIKFTTTDKILGLCGTLDSLGDACFALDVGLNTISSAGAVISGLEIYGITMSYTWGGVSFESDTSFNTTKHAIHSALYGGEELGFWVPVCPWYTVSVCESDCFDDVITLVAANPITEGYGYYEPICVETEKYEIFESFKIDVDGDSCCGGLIDFSVATYFGNHYELTGFGVYYAALNASAWTNIATYGTVATADVPDAPTASALTCQTATASTWTATGKTLFDWVKTSIDLELGIGPNWTADFGLSVTAFGWDQFSFGFTLEF